jgi:uncharacterized membrane protein
VEQQSTISVRRESRLSADAQRRMDVLLGYVLLVGVGVSMALIVVGLLWHFVRSGNLILDHQLAGMNLFQFLTEEIHVALREHIRPRTLVDFGVVVLMFTPYLRVLASMIYFMAVQKNWKYSVFTAIVLGVLTFSLFLR